MERDEIEVADARIHARETRPDLWVVSFYPKRQDHPTWPGWITDSSRESIPTDRGLDDVLDWARTEWERREASRR